MEAQNTEIRRCRICNQPLAEWQSENDPFCSNCSMNSFINSYSYKPTPRFFGHAGLNGNRRAFGIELEVMPRRVTVVEGQQVSASRELQYVRGITQKAFGDFAYLKSDGSLDSNGFEIVTHPATFRYLKTNRVFDVLRDLPVSSFRHSCTGLHIHVSRARFTELQLCKLVYFFSKPENVEYLIRVAQRDWTRNSYCQPIPKGKMKEFATATTRNGRASYHSRYHAINLTNETTVEFRMFKGNTKPEAIYRAIQFVDAMVDFTASTPATKLSAEDFLNFVDKNHNRYNLLASWNKGWKTAKLYSEVDHDRARRQF